MRIDTTGNLEMVGGVFERILDGHRLTSTMAFLRSLILSYSCYATMLRYRLSCKSQRFKYAAFTMAPIGDFLRGN
jgi:hypothetical protein